MEAKRSSESGGKSGIFVILAVLVGVLGTGAIGGTIYVDADANGANDGSGWADAFNFLQDALVDANTDPNVDEIRVAQGTYTPDSNSADPNGSSDREATFQLINGIAIYGGFPSGGDPNWNDRNPNLYETILSGDLNGDDGPDFVNNGENCYHVITGSGTDVSAVLDGFTVTGGNASGSLSDPNSIGGGMFNGGYSSPMVVNCTFRRNSAVWGGGMFNAGHSNPTVTNCTFSENEVSYNGGGMYNGDNSSPTVTNSTFSENEASYTGGGMYNDSNSSPVVAKCIFISNSADHGGGM